MQTLCSRDIFFIGSGFIVLGAPSSGGIFHCQIFFLLDLFASVIMSLGMFFKIETQVAQLFPFACDLLVRNARSASQNFPVVRPLGGRD